MQSLELKVPPPLVALLVGMAMWFAAQATPPLHLPSVVRVALTVMLALVGVAFSFSGVIEFRHAGTTPNPFRPESSSSLVSSGAFNFTRNPMYLGLFLMLLAWATALSSALALIGPFIFAAYVDRFQIRPEERALDALFGSRYAEYKARVRRWL